MGGANAFFNLNGTTSTTHTSCGVVCSLLVVCPTSFAQILESLYLISSVSRRGCCFEHKHHHVCQTFLARYNRQATLQRASSAEVRRMRSYCANQGEIGQKKTSSLLDDTSIYRAIRHTVPATSRHSKRLSFLRRRPHERAVQRTTKELRSVSPPSPLFRWR